MFCKKNPPMMKKNVVLFVVALALSLSAHAQLLYRISGNGLAKPSYVLGTYHLAAATFVDSIPGFHEAMQGVEQACGEVVMDNMNSPEMAQKMMAAMMLPEGKTIQGMLTTEQLDRLNALMKQLMGADLNTPMVGHQLGKMSPAALTTQLSLLMYMKFNPLANVQDGIDSHVQQLAKQQGKKVKGMETIDEQIHILFKSQTLERQLQLLMCMVKHQDYQLQMAQQIVKAYYAQDLDSILEITDMKFNDDCDSTEEEENTLIYGRNANWVKAMPAIMAETPTFFAYGAAHLAGEKGVLQLLRNAGYTVEPVK